MDDLQRVRSWVEAGKQVGKSFTFVRNGVTYWSSVAVQKWKDGYKLYVDEIEEEYIQGEAYEREEVIFKCSLSELEVLIKDYCTPRNFGQKTGKPDLRSSSTSNRRSFP